MEGIVIKRLFLESILILPRQIDGPNSITFIKDFHSLVIYKIFCNIQLFKSEFNLLNLIYI